MKKNRWWLATLGVIAWMLLHPGDSASAGEERVALDVGKKGIVTLDNETKVNDLTLLPGRYIVQHQTEGSEHFVRFKLLNPVRYDPFWRRGGKARCTLEYLKRQVVQTEVTLFEGERIDQLIELRVKGEDVARVF